MDDLISKKMALDALGERPMAWVGSDYELGARNQYDMDKLAIETVPPARPQDIARDIATIIENEKDMRVMLQQRWIPVTERLPEKRDWYLGIFKEPDTGWINPIPFICDYLLGEKTKATTKEGWILKECTDREEHIDYYFNLECVAWRESPKMWEGGQDGNT